MIKKLAPYTKGYRLLMLFAIACSAGEAVLELTLPQVMSDIVDIGIANGDRGYILMAGLKMVIMALLALGCGVGAAALAAKASMGFGAALRKAEYEQVQRFSFANIERFSTASLVTRLTNDVASVQMTTFMGMRMLVRAPTMLVTALVMALIISQRLSQVFLVVIPLLIIAVVIVIKRVGPFFTSLQGATDQLNLVVQEDLNAIRVVKSFVREAQEKEKFTQRSEKLRSMAERAFGFVVLFMPVMMILMGGTITAVMWIGGHYVWEGTLLSGDLIAFFTYVSEILMALMMVSVVLMMLTRAIACGKRIAEVLEEKPRITDEQADPALKVEDGSITLQIKGGGPLGTLLAVSDAQGNVRGWVENPQISMLEKYRGKLDVGAAVGNDGMLTVIRDLRMKDPYVGSVELVSGEIAEDITQYFAQSEQIPTACALGVLVDVDQSVRAAGGYIIQLLPGAPDATIDQIEAGIRSAGNVTALLDSGMDAEQLLKKVLDGFDVEILETAPVEYRCA